MRKLSVFLFALAALLPAQGRAARLRIDPASHPALSHRHGLELGVGMLSEARTGTSVGVGGTVVASADASGLMGTVTYLYGLDDRLALTLSGGGLSADASTSVSGGNALVETSSVSRALVGMRWFFPAVEQRGVLRPYVAVGVGPFVGHASNVVAGSTTQVEDRTETALGGRLGLGATLGLNSWLAIGAGAGYNFVGDFSERIGARRNYSSPDFLVSLAWRFGQKTLP